MDYCERTLRHVIDEGTLFNNPTKIWHIFGQIIEGLVYMHSQGIIHRDVSALEVSNYTRDLLTVAIA